MIDNLKDKDILFLIGGDTYFEGYSVGIDSLKLIKQINAKTIVIQSWEEETAVDDIFGLKDLIKENFLGTILNKVTPEQYLYLKETVVPYLTSKGIRVFGILPREKFLEAITVRRLLEIVNGEIICGEDKLDELVENFLVGAMDPGQAFSYFLKVQNKAVITGVHRTDIQILAMETSTKGLILTGGHHVNENIITVAISKGIPIIATTLDTFSAVERIQKIMGKTIIKEKDKAIKAKEIIARDFDLEGFLEALKI